MRDVRSKGRVVLLAPFIHPYRIPLFERLGEELQDLHILVSTILRPEDPRPAEWTRLDVHVQRRLSFQRTWRHPGGFSEPFGVHIPYDTLSRLWRYRPDVVISTEMGPRTVQAALYRLLDPRTRLIVWAAVSEHNEQGRGRLRHLVRRLLLLRADAVLVNGASGARYIRGLGVPSEKLFFVPYTAAITAPDEPRPPSSGLPQRLLYVGQLVERKGLEPFLDVLTRWASQHQDRKVEFALVGSGPLRDQLAAMSTPDNLTVRFLERVPNHELGKIYADADIFVFPTLSDEWGVVVNEAMAMGLPVLGSLYSQAVEELVVNDLSGWTFLPDDPDGMYDALERALGTPGERLHEMAMHGQQTIDDLSPDKIAHRVVEAVRHVV